MRTMVIIGCKCGKRGEFRGEYAQIQRDIAAAGWKEWDRKTGNAVCKECTKKSE